MSEIRSEWVEVVVEQQQPVEREAGETHSPPGIPLLLQSACALIPPPSAPLSLFVSASSVTFSCFCHCCCCYSAGTRRRGSTGSGCAYQLWVIRADLSSSCAISDLMCERYDAVQDNNYCSGQFPSQRPSSLSIL